MIELIVFIAVVGIAVVGILSVMNLNIRHSVDPLLQKQALAIAEALLEEVERMPFTICDPDDGVGANPATCNREDTTIGPESGEQRDSPTTPFDNVSDYSGFSLTDNGIDLGNATHVVVPPGYAATVTVAAEAPFGPVAPGSDNVLRITVRVTYHGDQLIVLNGFRARYAPNITP